MEYDEAYRAMVAWKRAQRAARLADPSGFVESPPPEPEPEPEPPPPPFVFPPIKDGGGSDA